VGLRLQIGVLICASLLLGACDTNLRGDVPPVQPTGVSRDPIQLPLGRSGPTISDEPAKPDGRHQMFAVSGEATEGQPYVFELDARCGIDHRVDFDGRLWDAVDRPESLRGQRTVGTMTLVNRQLAEFLTSDGVRIRFIRHIGKKFAEPCD
jgi:hypothetical protein